MGEGRKREGGRNINFSILNILMVNVPSFNLNLGEGGRGEKSCYILSPAREEVSRHQPPSLPPFVCARRDGYKHRRNKSCVIATPLAHKRAHTHIHAHTHTHTYIHIHIHIHTHTQPYTYMYISYDLVLTYTYYLWKYFFRIVFSRILDPILECHWVI